MSTTAEQLTEAEIRLLPLASIRANPKQPRKHFDSAALGELAASIREVGILQPVVVRPVDGEGYELIAGERRFRASQLAGLELVPALILRADSLETLELALIENLQREDVTPLELASAYRRLIVEFGLTQEQVAAKVGKSRVSVANSVRLLRLPDRILRSLEAKEISEAHARVLLGFPDPITQLAVCQQVVTKGMTVKQLERLASKVNPKSKRRNRAEKTDPNWPALAESLSNALGAPVRLEPATVGGRLTIEFFDEDDLARIAESILG